MGLQDHLLLLLTLSFQLAIINLSVWIELLLRPVLRLLRRLLAPSRWLYALMRLGNNSRWRLETRTDILEELYKLVMNSAKAVEEERPAESYDSTVVYLPAIKLQVCKCQAEAEAVKKANEDHSTYFEAWAVMQEGNLLRSYISEALAQKMRLRQYSAPWDQTGQTTIVDVVLKPATSDVGLPLVSGMESPRYPLHSHEPPIFNDSPVQMVVLPMEAFGRIDVRMASPAAEAAAEAVKRPLTTPNRSAEEEEEERTEGSVTAQMILGQSFYADHFIHYSNTQVKGGGGLSEGLAFLNFGPFGNIVVGGKDGGEYLAYSAAKTIWLWVFGLIIGPLYLLQIYLQLYIFCLLLHWKPLLIFLNRVFAPGLLFIFLLLTAIRFSLRGEYGAGRLLKSAEKNGSSGRWSKCARGFAAFLDDALLRAFYWLIDGRHTVPELAGKECTEYRQYWYRWMRWLVRSGGLVPTLRAPPTPSNSHNASRSVHFADQHEFLPEESRAEMGSDQRRFRMVMRARVLNPKRLTDNEVEEEEEIRILLNPCIDHSVITEKAVAKLGLRRQAIWPRFQWGLYPRDDDMAICTEMVSLTIAPSRAYTPTVTIFNPLADPASPVNLELLVVARQLTSDRPLPPALHKQLQREFSVQLSDIAPPTPKIPTSTLHHVDIVIGADQMYSAFFSDEPGVMRCSSYTIPVKDLLGFEIGLLRQTSTGFGAVFAGFEKLLDEEGKLETERKRTFLEQMWKKWGYGGQE